MDIKIDVIQTGSVRIRNAQLTQPPGNVLLRRLNFLVDRTYTEPLPIYAFLIHHPSGKILFDLGETPKCVEPGYYPWYQIGQHVVHMLIKPGDGLGDQLRKIGVDPATDIPTVVLSHLHSDHAGGLDDIYGSAKIYTSPAHWKSFKHPFHATVEGANPRAWPNGFLPTMLEATGPAIGPWETSYPITADGKIVAVDTPGHVPGHVSLIVFSDNVTYFLCGDAAYSLDLLDKELVDGINSEPLVALDSMRKIKQFCHERDVVVLPSHDLETRNMLVDGTLYRPNWLNGNIPDRKSNL